MDLQQTFPTAAFEGIARGGLFTQHAGTAPAETAKLRPDATCVVAAALALSGASYDATRGVPKGCPDLPLGVGSCVRCDRGPGIIAEMLTGGREAIVELTEDPLRRRVSCPVSALVPPAHGFCRAKALAALNTSPVLAAHGIVEVGFVDPTADVHTHCIARAVWPVDAFMRSTLADRLAPPKHADPTLTTATVLSPVIDDDLGKGRTPSNGAPCDAQRTAAGGDDDDDVVPVDIGSHLAEGVPPPSPGHAEAAVANDDDEDDEKESVETLIVACRGTAQGKDWWTNFFPPLDGAAPADGAMQQVHGGFLMRCRSVPLEPIVAHVLGGGSVVFTGHSQGSSVAELLCMKLLDHLIAIEDRAPIFEHRVLFLGFASPVIGTGQVGFWARQRGVDHLFHRVQLGRDPVPALTHLARVREVNAHVHDKVAQGATWIAGALGVPKLLAAGVGAGVAKLSNAVSQRIAPNFTKDFGTWYRVDHESREWTIAPIGIDGQLPEKYIKLDDAVMNGDGVLKEHDLVTYVAALAPLVLEAHLTRRSARHRPPTLAHGIVPFPVLFGLPDPDSVTAAASIAGLGGDSLRVVISSDTPAPFTCLHTARYQPRDGSPVIATPPPQSTASLASAAPSALMAQGSDPDVLASSAAPIPESLSANEFDNLPPAVGDPVTIACHAVDAGRCGFAVVKEKLRPYVARAVASAEFRVPIKKDVEMGTLSLRGLYSGASVCDEFDAARTVNVPVQPAAVDNTTLIGTLRHACFLALAGRCSGAAETGFSELLQCQLTTLERVCSSHVAASVTTTEQEAGTEADHPSACLLPSAASGVPIAVYSLDGATVQLLNFDAATQFLSVASQPTAAPLPTLDTPGLLLTLLPAGGGAYHVATVLPAAGDCGGGAATASPTQPPQQQRSSLGRAFSSLSGGRGDPAPSAPGAGGPVSTLPAVQRFLTRGFSFVTDRGQAQRFRLAASGSGRSFFRLLREPLPTALDAPLEEVSLYRGYIPGTGVKVTTAALQRGTDLTIYVPGTREHVFPSPTKDVLVSCARLLTYEHVTRGVADDEGGSLVEDAHRFIARHPRQELLSRAAAAWGEGEADAAALLDPTAGSTPLAHSLPRLKSGGLPPVVPWRDVTAAWDDVPVTSEPPLTRYFFLSMPALTHAALVACNCGFHGFAALRRAGLSKGKRVRSDGEPSFLSRAFAALKGVFRTPGAAVTSDAFTTIDRDYAARVTVVCALVQHRATADVREAVQRGERPAVTLEELHSKLLQAAEAVDGFASTLHPEWWLDPRNVRTVMPDLAAAPQAECRSALLFLAIALQVARVAATVRRASVCTVYGRQKIGKTTLLSLLLDKQIDSLRTQAHTIEPSVIVNRMSNCTAADAPTRAPASPPAFGATTDATTASGSAFPPHGNTLIPCTTCGRSHQAPQHGHAALFVIDVPAIDDSVVERGCLQALVMGVARIVIVAHSMEKMLWNVFEGTGLRWVAKDACILIALVRANEAFAGKLANYEQHGYPVQLVRVEATNVLSAEQKQQDDDNDAAAPLDANVKPVSAVEFSWDGAVYALASSGDASLFTAGPTVWETVYEPQPDDGVADEFVMCDHRGGSREEAPRVLSALRRMEPAPTATVAVVKVRDAPHPSPHDQTVPHLGHGHWVSPSGAALPCSDASEFDTGAVECHGEEPPEWVASAKRLRDEDHSAGSRPSTTPSSSANIRLSGAALLGTPLIRDPQVVDVAVPVATDAAAITRVVQELDEALALDFADLSWPRDRAALLPKLCARAVALNEDPAAVERVLSRLSATPPPQALTPEEFVEDAAAIAVRVAAVNRRRRRQEAPLFRALAVWRAVCGDACKTVRHMRSVAPQALAGVPRSACQLFIPQDTKRHADVFGPAAPYISLTVRTALQDRRRPPHPVVPPVPLPSSPDDRSRRLATMLGAELERAALRRTLGQMDLRAFIASAAGTGSAESWLVNALVRPDE